MDVILATDDALFIPVYGDYFTASWDVGARKAKEILFENRFLTAPEARECVRRARSYLEEDIAR
ncbi:MAG TPA: hypothetical protein VMU94_02280 [Streptosporangiaceae bacterium]|nr:hypothetical protein [Streptosporangiaceae bacterium]